MPLLFTEPSDVRTRWVGEGLTASDEQITTLLEDAEDTVLREFPDLPDRIDADPTAVPNAIPSLRVKKVVARVVMRHLRNPSGERSRQEMSGPFSQNVTFGGEEPGALYLTDEDRAELGGSLTGAAFSIDQTPPTDAPDSPGGWLVLGRTYLV